MTEPVRPSATDKTPGASKGRSKSPLAAIVQKEVREIVRDGRFRMVALSSLGLLLVALGFGLSQAQAVHAEREAAEHGAEEHWKTQDDKNPHVAAHYGTHVFKPAAALAFLDPGVDPFVGSSIKLEAHRRNDVTAASALDATGLSRFGGLSVAGVLALLVPLLAIALGFAAWAGERERGTLRQLASLGVPTRLLLGGKALGLGLSLAIFLVPGALVVFGAATLWAEAGGAGSWARLAGFGAAYAAYFAVFLAVTLAVSARAASSRGALVALLAFWVGVALVAPRAASDAAAWLAPAPTHAATAAAVQESLVLGLPGGAPREDHIGEITEKLLDEQGYAGAETLMDASLLAGIELQAEAAFESAVIDHHFAQLADAVDRQERTAEAFGFVSPVIAVRTLSRAFAGTDVAHHRGFSEAAEAQRRRLVDVLNREFAEKGGAQAWDYRAGPELWAKVPPFAYEPPVLGALLARHRISLGALSGWLVLSAFAAWRTAARMRVV